MKYVIIFLVVMKRIITLESTVITLGDIMDFKIRFLRRNDLYKIKSLIFAFLVLMRESAISNNNQSVLTCIDIFLGVKDSVTPSLPTKMFLDNISSVKHRKLPQ